MEPIHPLTDPENELRAQVAYLKNSREFVLGSRLRQSFLFKLARRWRLSDRLVKITSLAARSAPADDCQVCLVGIWNDDYPAGMPLELLERGGYKWHDQPLVGAPFGSGLLTTQADVLNIYSRDEKLHLDFVVNGNSGLILVESKAGQRRIDLYSATPGIISVYPNRPGVEIIRQAPGEEGLLEPVVQPAGQSAILPTRPASRGEFTPADRAWLESQAQPPRPLSLGHPEWRGILSASKQLFDNVYTIPDNLDRVRAAYYAALIHESGVPSVTIQGFPLSYTHLVKALRKIDPRLPIFVIYHGNYLHVREDYDWSSFKAIKALHDDGDIVRVGFVKLGMAEVMTAAGMRCSFIMNLVRQIPTGPSQPLPGGRHVGIWGQPDWSWKKPPYAMIAALKLVPGAQAHVYNVSPRAQEYGSFLGVAGEYVLEGVAQDQVPLTMAQMHVNLYVTLTECAPMMPLESLAIGAPCLLGPNSPYFNDNPYLHERLVVPYPEQAEVIAAHTRRALAERTDIIQAYQDYAPGYNQRALAVLAEFLQTSRSPA